MGSQLVKSIVAQHLVSFLVFQLFEDKCKKQAKPRKFYTENIAAWKQKITESGGFLDGQHTEYNDELIEAINEIEKELLESAIHIPEERKEDE